MDLRTIHEFVVLADYCNYQRAADALYIGKSTLSKHISGMEAELKQPLFERTTRQVALTEFGAGFLLYAREIDRMWGTVQRELISPAPEKRPFRLGLFPLMPVYGFTEVLDKFAAAFPDCRLSLVEGEAEQTRNAVRSGDCSAGLILTGEEPAGDLEEHIIDRDEMVALVAESGQLGRDGALPVAQLAGENLLLLPVETYASRSIIEACRASGFEPRVGYRTQYGGMLRDMAAGGMGVAFMAGGCAVRPGGRGLRVVPLRPAVPLTIRLVVREGDRDPRVEWLKRTLLD